MGKGFKIRVGASARGCGRASKREPDSNGFRFEQRRVRTVKDSDSGEQDAGGKPSTMSPPGRFVKLAIRMRNVIYQARYRTIQKYFPISVITFVSENNEESSRRPHIFTLGPRDLKSAPQGITT